MRSRRPYLVPLSAAIALAALVGAGATSPGLRASLHAAGRAFADPALIEPAPVDPGAADRAIDTTRLIEAELRQDFKAAKVEDFGKLEDPDGAAVASLVTPDLPVPITRRTLRYVKFLASTEAGRESFAQRYKRAGRYRQIVEHALREAGLPEDLVWLAAVESGFNPQATSPAGASGMFQFMPETGALYGLWQSPYVDERRSLTRSTTAAVTHLRDLYERFGRWDLTLAAYNAGYTAVTRAMDRAAQAQDRAGLPPTPVTFAELAEAGLLPKETINYVPQISAFAIVAANRGRFDLDSVEPDPALELGQIAAPEGTRLSTIARAANISLDALRDYNPELLRDRLPPVGGDILVSVPADRVAQARATLPAYMAHEVVELSDVVAEVLTPGVAAEAASLPSRPIALGKNRLPVLEAKAPRAPVDFSALSSGAKLPVASIGSGVGWIAPERAPIQDSFGLLRERGEDSADAVIVDASLERVTREILAAPAAIERFRVGEAIDVELRRDPSAAFVSLTASLALTDVERPGAVTGESHQTVTVLPGQLDVGVDLVVDRLSLLAAATSDDRLLMLRKRGSAPRYKALEKAAYGPAWLAMSEALFPAGSPRAGTLLGTANLPAGARDLWLADELDQERSRRRLSVRVEGQVDGKRVKDLLTRATWRLASLEPKTPTPEPADAMREERVTVEQDVPATRLLYGWTTPGEGEDGDAAMRVAMELLSLPKFGRLPLALGPMTAQLSVTMEPGPRVGAATVELTPALPYGSNAIEEALGEALSTLAERGPGAQELALAKQRVRARLDKEREAAKTGVVAPGSPLGTTSARVRGIMQPGLYDRLLDAVGEVNAKDVRQAVRHTLVRGRRVVVTTVPTAATPQGG